MNESSKLDAYRMSLSKKQQEIFDQLRALIHQAYPDVSETIFSKHPYFYLPEYESNSFHTRPSIMFAFFGDHVNLFALANNQYEKILKSYHFTEKHTMQIRLDQILENDKLLLLFKESLKMDLKSRVD